MNSHYIRNKIKIRVKTMTMTMTMMLQLIAACVLLSLTAQSVYGATLEDEAAWYYGEIESRQRSAFSAGMNMLQAGNGTENFNLQSAPDLPAQPLIGWSHLRLSNLYSSHTLYAGAGYQSEWFQLSPAVSWFTGKSSGNPSSDTFYGSLSTGLTYRFYKLKAVLQLRANTACLNQMRFCRRALAAGLEYGRHSLSGRFERLSDDSGLAVSYNWQAAGGLSLSTGYDSWHSYLWLGFRWSFGGQSIHYSRGESADQSRNRLVIDLATRQRAGVAETGMPAGKLQSETYTDSQLPSVKQKSGVNYNPYSFISLSLLLRWGVSLQSAWQLARCKDNEAAFEEELLKLPRHDYLAVAGRLQKVYRRKK